MAEQNRFGEPEVTVVAPGRVNLIGEHTDYNDGYVMPVAIDKAIRLDVRVRRDRLCRLYSSALQEEAQFVLDHSHLEAGDLPSWVRYPAGVAYMLRHQTDRPLSGVDVVISSTLPIGAGLSSSAAFEAAFAVLWNEIDHLNLDRWTLAKLCQRAEQEYAGVKCGIMDQAASLMCKRGQALLLDTRTLEFKQVPLPNEWAIVVADTGKPRSLSVSEYNQRRMECEKAALAFNDWLGGLVHTLRDVPLGMFMKFAPNLSPEVLKKRAFHVIGENERVLALVDVLHRKDAYEVGLLMAASHASLRDEYDVSCPELDGMQSICAQIPGCIGVRMTGAGFGGACVALVQQDQVGAFIQCAAQRYSTLYPYKPAFYVCEAVDGASVTWLAEGRDV